MGPALIFWLFISLSVTDEGFLGDIKTKAFGTEDKCFSYLKTFEDGETAKFRGCIQLTINNEVKKEPEKK